jgi:hypothetical protein
MPCACMVAPLGTCLGAHMLILTVHGCGNTTCVHTQSHKLLLTAGLPASGLVVAMPHVCVLHVQQC